MAKKKVARKKKSSKKATVKNQAVKKKTAKKKTTKKKTVKKKVPAAKSTRSKKVVRKKTSVSDPKSMTVGRPKIAGDVKLYLLFKEDYHARQCFEFLRVETVRELENLGPKDIIRKLTEPMKYTVERIRAKLAESNRCLKEDGEFLLEYRSRGDG